MGNAGFKVVEDLLGDEDIVTFRNNKVSMKELRKLENRTIKDERTRHTIIFWDDVAQFTTLGLIDLLLKFEDDLDHKEFSYNDFFYRKVEHTDPIIITKHIFKDNFGIKLEEEYILGVFKKYYTNILLSSPVSSFWATLVKMESMYSSLTFCFRYKFDGMDKFVESYVEHLTGKHTFPLLYDCLPENGRVEDYLKNSERDPDIIMVQDIGAVYKFIEDTQRENLNIVGPNVHNNIPEELQTLLAFTFKTSNRGPLNSEITLYNEGIHKCYNSTSSH